MRRTIDWGRVWRRFNREHRRLLKERSGPEMYPQSQRIKIMMQIIEEAVEMQLKARER